MALPHTIFKWQIMWNLQNSWKSRGTLLFLRLELGTGKCFFILRWTLFLRSELPKGTILPLRSSLRYAIFVTHIFFKSPFHTGPFIWNKWIRIPHLSKGWINFKTLKKLNSLVLLSFNLVLGYPFRLGGQRKRINAFVGLATDIRTNSKGVNNDGIWICKTILNVLRFVD